MLNTNTAVARKLRRAMLQVEAVKSRKNMHYISLMSHINDISFILKQSEFSSNH